jgi:hypothetical protein
MLATPAAGPVPFAPSIGAAPQAAAPAAPAAGAAPAAPPDPNAPTPVNLRDFQTQDQSARGKVPDEPGWMTGGVNGAIEAANPMRGEMHLGIPAVVCLPGGMTAQMAPMYGWVVAPYMPAGPAVQHVWLQLRNMLEPGGAYNWLQIDGAHPMNWGPPFDVGLFQIRFRRGNVTWEGAILVATTPLPNDDRWLFYYSQVAVPESDDGSVYQALLTAWKEYDSSKAQANQTAAALKAQQDAFKILDEIYWSRQEAQRTA